MNKQRASAGIYLHCLCSLFRHYTSKETLYLILLMCSVSTQIFYISFQILTYRHHLHPNFQVFSDGCSCSIYCLVTLSLDGAIPKCSGWNHIRSLNGLVSVTVFLGSSSHLNVTGIGRIGSLSPDQTPAPPAPRMGQLPRCPPFPLSTKLPASAGYPALSFTLHLNLCHLLVLSSCISVKEKVFSLFH